MLRTITELTTILLIACVVIITPFIVEARTWYVKQDGSGDAPSISAAVDSAVAGDTVLVAPGVYETIGVIELKEGLIVTSEAGARNTKIAPQPYQYPLYLFSCENFLSYTRTEISGFWIEGFQYSWANGGTILIESCYELYIKNNIMTRNDIAISISAVSPIPSLVYIHGNTFTDNLYYAVLGGYNNVQGYIENNIVWGDCEDIGAYWIITCNCFFDLSDIPSSWTWANFSLDPQFCGTYENGNLYLQSDSPCAPGNSPQGSQCDLIGALPVGCGAAATKKITWGALKNIYKR